MQVYVYDGDTGVPGIAIVTVDTVDYAVTIERSGNGYVDIPNLPHSEYSISASFLGNDNYTAVDYEGDAKIIVGIPSDIYFDLEIDDEHTEVTVADIRDAEVDPLDSFEVTAKLYLDGEFVIDLECFIEDEETATIDMLLD